MTDQILNGAVFHRTGEQRRKANGATYIKWRWVKADDRRRATAAETRVLNRMAAEAPAEMSLPGTHPSYRVG